MIAVLELTNRQLDTIAFVVVIVVGIIAWAIVRSVEARHGIVRDAPWIDVKLRGDELCPQCPHQRHDAGKCAACSCTSPLRYRKAS